MDETRIKQTLQTLNIDAYIIYDFRKSNFLGREVLGLEHFTTRRFVCVLAQNGFFHIVPRMESLVFANLSGEKLYYTTYQEYQDLLKKTISNYKTLAVDFSDNNDLPIVDLAPAGFLMLLKKLHPSGSFVSSANLTQYLSALWGEHGYRTHTEASAKLKVIFAEIFDVIKKALKDNKKITDFDVMQFALGRFKELDLHDDGEDVCIIATNERTANPHYWPKEHEAYPIESNSVLLVDMWARLTEKDSIYSDYTKYAWIGPDTVPSEVEKAWQAFVKARDLGVDFLESHIATGLAGYELDQVVRKSLVEDGYGAFLLHRSGHSLGKKEHGNGANIDDFETHDTRLIVPDTGITLEPGIYMPKYGVRGEIDIYIHPDKRIEVTTERRQDLIVL